jgi:hypothetical protein
MMSSGDAEAHDVKLQRLAEELSVTKETLETRPVHISTARMNVTY